MGVVGRGFDRVALELLLLLCTFKNSSKVAKYRSIEILFRIAKRSVFNLILNNSKNSDCNLEIGSFTSLSSCRLLLHTFRSESLSLVASF